MSAGSLKYKFTTVPEANGFLLRKLQFRKVVCRGLPYSVLLSTFTLLSYFLATATGSPNVERCTQSDQIRVVAYGQASLDNILARFHLNIGAIRDLKSTDAAFNSLLDKLSMLVNEIEVWAKGISPAGIGAVYRDSLSLDADLLTRSVGGDRSLLVKDLGEVYEDLKIKMRYTKASKGAGAALVQLIVSTVTDSKEVNDCEIWFVARGWMGVREKYRRFDDLSSPSMMNLAAGNYLVWVERDGLMIADRMPITLGDDGHEVRRVKLAVH